MFGAVEAGAAMVVLHGMRVVFERVKSTRGRGVGGA